MTTPDDRPPPPPGFKRAPMVILPDGKLVAPASCWLVTVDVFEERELASDVRDSHWPLDKIAGKYGGQWLTVALAAGVDATEPSPISRAAGRGRWAAMAASFRARDWLVLAVAAAFMVFVAGSDADAGKWGDVVLDSGMAVLLLGMACAFMWLRVYGTRRAGKP